MIYSKQKLSEFFHFIDQMYQNKKIQLLFTIDLLAGLGDLVPIKILFLYLPDQENSQLGKATFCHRGSIRLNIRIAMSVCQQNLLQCYIQATEVFFSTAEHIKR